MTRTVYVPRFGRGAAVAVVLSTALLVTAPDAAPARAQSGPGGKADTTPPVKIDGSAHGLRMRPGAKLAPGRVLDIKSVVETDDGGERREDTNVDVTFALQAEVLFDKDSATLGAEAGKRIRAIADEVRKRHATTLRVFGFTDNLGSAEHGVQLSKQRADAVQRQLAQNIGSSGVAYQIRGYGEDYPIADNSTEEGRRRNRRVEVSFPTRG
ncbi:OmpA family protein [Streptomyces sp. NPDC001407]|uniref:OmpA family protein n=1 Tax=unclassified Streptomyces TaxID=2593676 RepID=UPI00340A6A9E